MLTQSPPPQDPDEPAPRADPFAGLLNPPHERPGDGRGGMRGEHVPRGRVHLMKDHGRGLPELSKHEERELAAIPLKPSIQAERAAKAAKPKPIYAPLEPGQKRRRRINEDGTPVRKLTERRRRAAEKAMPMEYKGPVRAPGAMTYGAAARLICRANDGDLVDLEDLAAAHDTVREARESGAIS